MNLPSKTGLWISRLCLAIQRVILAALALYCLWHVHFVLAIIVGLALVAWSLITFDIRKFTSLRDREWVKRNPHLLDTVPDYWQKKWLDEAKQYDMKPGDEWRIAQATGLSLIAMTVLVLAMHRLSPDSAPPLAQSIWLISLVSFVLGSALGSKTWYKQTPTRRYRGNDPDGGFAGVGARITPPMPTLEAGERREFPG